MKIFYKKDFQEDLIKYKNLFVICEAERKTINDLEIKNRQLRNTLEQDMLLLQMNDDEIGDLKSKLNDLQNRYESLNQDYNNLQKKYEDSMTDKYIVRKIPSGRTPNTIKTKVSKTVKSNITNYMKKESIR